MDWNNIKEKYPKSFKEASEWWGMYNTALVQLPKMSVPKTIRDLYDFFDLWGVHVEIFFLAEKKNFLFRTTIIKKEIYFYTDSNFKTRKEAEEKAFTKAFEILEEKITK